MQSPSLRRSDILKKENKRKEDKMKKNGKWVFMLVILVIAVAVIPLFLNSFNFAGSDDAAGKAVTTVDPNYKPWAKPITVPGEKTETLLFCLQAGIGAGVLGLGFGYLVLRKKNQKGND
jgi:cobalt/nickel transport protein